MPCTANSRACWPEPHLRSIVTDGHVDRVAGREPGLAARRAGLLAGLADAADHEVLDGPGVDAGAVHQSGEGLGEQVDAVQAGQGPALLAASHGGADGIDDDGLGHGISGQQAP